MAAKKNSLVGNINRRKRAGTSRPKLRTTISPGAYREMQEGWPRSGKKKARKKKRTTTQRKSAQRESNLAA
jgi:hypothetical protein